MKLQTCVAALVVAGCAAAAESGRVTTTVYVGKHFEVRDHDQPVKYVFNGATRVARVTGSLSANARIQRLRLRGGWNLVSLAVTADDLVGQIQRGTSGQLSMLDTIYRVSSTNGYVAVASGSAAEAGSVLWIKANTNAVVGIVGRYAEPLPHHIPAGGGHVAGPGFEVGLFDLPATVTVWKYDAATARWQTGLRGDLATAADLPPQWAPGEAVFLQADAPAELSIPDPASRVAFYQQDHLGSSSAVTDAAGALIEETAYYPFGVTRHEERLRRVEAHYQFTQKERDRESGLHYFEARYLAAPLGRFLSVDPLLAGAGSAEKAFPDPQRLNHYAYTLNNPLRFIDPNGHDAAKPSVAKPAAPLTLRSGIQIKLGEPDVAGQYAVRDLWTSYFRNVADPTIPHRDWAEWRSSNPEYVKNATSGKLPDHFTALFLGYEGNASRETDMVYGLNPKVSIRTFYVTPEAEHDPAVRAAAEQRTAQIVEYLSQHPLPKFRNIRQPGGYYSSQKSLEAFSEQQELYKAKMYQSFETKNSGTTK